MKQGKKKLACTKRKQTVRRRDLPLSCPPDASVLWNAHPKVYLAIEATGHAACPYCGTAFSLKDD